MTTLTRIDSLLLLDLLQAPQQGVDLHLDLSQLPLDGLQLVGLHWDTQTHQFRETSPSSVQSLSFGAPTSQHKKVAYLTAFAENLHDGFMQLQISSMTTEASRKMSKISVITP